MNKLIAEAQIELISYGLLGNGSKKDMEIFKRNLRYIYNKEGLKISDNEIKDIIKELEVVK